MKRVLLAFIVTTLAVPTAARADGGGNGTGCGNTLCKPHPLLISTFAVSTAAKADGGGNGTGCGKTMCKP